MIQIILLGILLFAALVILLTGLIAGIVFFTKKLRDSSLERSLNTLKKAGVALGVTVIAMGGLFLFSGLTAHTPVIVNEQGESLTGSIAELTQITCNGRKEWVSIRGENAQNPVLLFLAGGPGGTQMAAVRHELSELEQHFVVVNWDQPGSGKSYVTAQMGLNVDDYIQDGLSLTSYLQERF